MPKIPLFLSLDDILLVPQHSYINSRSEVDLSWKMGNFTFTHPIIPASMDSVVGVEMAVSMAESGSFAILPRFDTPEIQAEKVKKIKAKNLPIGASVGIKTDELHRLKLLVKAGVDHINVDVAHGHLESMLNFVKEIRRQYPKLNLSAGVVATYQGAVDLFQAGVDIVKVGVGGGSICITRIQTGCGVPQFTAVSECAKAARKFGKIIWADAGMKNSGDIVKCLAAGASAVMTGNILAGTKETPPKTVTINGKKYKPYNGSTSLAEKINQVKRNKQDKTATYVLHIEGVEGFVPYKGPVADVIANLLAGIKSGYSYCNARNTQELWKNAKFIRVSPIGLRENGAHDIIQA